MKTTVMAAALGALTLAGCVETTGSVPAPASTTPPSVSGQAGISVSRFNRVVSRIEGVAEAACRQRVRTGVNCDFKVVLDQDPREPANAYQSQERGGRPVLTFNVALLDDMRNDDEVAFVFGHEAAHHIAGHLAQTQQTATLGALVGGGLAVLLGGGQSAIDVGANLGGSVGARAYSKEFELEADALGARITHDAGYNPVRGAEFFNRIPDPGDRFLGSHPPNADRIATVRRTAAGF